MKDLSMHILDIVQNSVRASAGLINIEIIEDPGKDIYRICITDNGSGMDNETLEKVVSPFYTSRTTRKVGLGIPLFKQNAESTEAGFPYNQNRSGTQVTADFGLATSTALFWAISPKHWFCFLAHIPVSTLFILITLPAGITRLIPAK
jgi:K+-sensing histidine kinase KdpD